MLCALQEHIVWLSGQQCRVADFAYASQDAKASIHTDESFHRTRIQDDGLNASHSSSANANAEARSNRRLHHFELYSKHPFTDKRQQCRIPDNGGLARDS